MGGHALKGPNQKASVGKNLQDYQMRDGKLVPISTGEYDEILDSTGGSQTIVGDASKSQVPISEGTLVSDKMTGEARKASGTGKYKVEGNSLVADEVPEDYYNYETDNAKKRRLSTYKSEYQGLDKDDKALYKDVESQKKINKKASQINREANEKTVANKKMKFGRKKK